MTPVKLALISALAFAWAVSAQTSEPVEQAFSADRPGFATSPAVLQRGLMQFEGGVTYSMDSDGDVRHLALTFGSPLIRMGVGRSVELRVAGDGFRRVQSIDSDSRDSVAGWSDLAVGAKFAVVPQGQILPAIPLLPSISVPTGHRAFTSSTYDPSLAVAWVKSLPAGLSIGGTFTGTSISDERARFAQYSSAVSLGIPAPARSSGYVEVYAVDSGAPGAAATWISDAGLSRNLGSNLQIDIELGRRISHGAPCWFAAVARQADH